MESHVESCQPFKIDLRSFNKKYPDIKKPKIYSCFSIDHERNYVPDATNFMYVHLDPREKQLKVNLDLNKGYEDVVTKSHLLSETERLTHLLNYIDNNWCKHVSRDNSRFLSADIICFRGLLTQIMCTPYEYKEGWTICASLWRGNIYLCAFKSKEKIEELKNMSEINKKFSSYGFKFEQYMLTATPGTKPDTSKPVIEAEEFCCVFETQLANNRILLAAEMDGAYHDPNITKVDDETLPKLQFVEMKTIQNPDSYRHVHTLRRYKHIKWWCQCYLVAISDILCGVRNQQGIVDTVHLEKVAGLPSNARELWDPNVCLHFLDSFLSFIRTTVQQTAESQEKPSTVWKFDYNPLNRNLITVCKIREPSEFTFLSQWFIDKTKIFNM